MVPLGIQFAAAATVGGQVGAGNVALAKRHAVTHHVFAVVVMSAILVIIRANEDSVARVFTSDETDIRYILEVLDIISLYLVLDAVHGVNTGLVRALGQQLKASIATLCCYYALGMPLAIVFGFRMEMGVRGFWLGFTLAMALQDLTVSSIIVCADWNLAAKGDGARSDKTDDERDGVHKQLLPGQLSDGDYIENQSTRPSSRRVSHAGKGF